MRRVDRWLGRPLCFGLTLLRRVLPEREIPARDAVRRVLFVKLSEMGAIALAAPAFREVRSVFPDAEPHLLCFEGSAEIATVAGGLHPDQVHVVRTGGLFRTLFGLFGGVWRMRRQRFDVIVDLEYLSRVGAALTYLARAPVRAGFHRFLAEGLYCGDLYTHRATWNPYLHVAQSMVMLVRAAARSPEESPLPKEPAPSLSKLTFPSFTPTAEGRATVIAKLQQAGVRPGTELLLVNPNSSDLLPLRRWPRQHFIELIQQMRSARPASWIVLTGARDEVELANIIIAELSTLPGGRDRVSSLVGQTSFTELLTLYSMSAMLISADSGPPHFASLTDILGIALFGPETPDLYGPVSRRIRPISRGLACSPCIHAWNRRASSCTDNVCMQEISPRVVTQAALALLADK